MKRLRVSTCILSFMILSGCSIQSSQLSMLIGLVKTPQLDLSTNAWSVKYVDYEAIVYAVSVPEGTLFSNNAGDEVLFDGWSIRRVRGLGHRGSAYQNSDVDNQRSFKRGRVGLAIHLCDDWQVKVQSGKTRFSQRCGSQKTYTNSILVVEDGSISSIRQVVDDRYTTVTLTKLR